MDASEWTGPVGDVWAKEWRRTDRSFADLARHLDRTILARIPDRPIRVADIGCGAGTTSIAIATARPDAQVTGFDISPALVAIARRRAAALSNTRFVAAPVEDAIRAGGPFDLVVSRHGVMFFDDPATALASIRAAAAPGAGLVFSCFRAARHNSWAVEPTDAMAGKPTPPSPGYRPGPFGFADMAFVRATLDAAGWVDVVPRSVDFIYRAGQGDDAVADAVGFFSRIGPAARALRAADAADRATMLARLTAVCARRQNGDAVDFPASAWLWSARNT